MSVGRIKEFDMETGSWTLYCDRVEMYFQANEVKEALKLPTLISVVGDSVYELMVNLANPKKPTDLTYKELVKLVRDHVEPKPSIWAERYRFRQRRQAPGENIMQYVAALKKLSKDCDFSTALNDNLRDQFVCGVCSELIRQRLFTEPVTLTFANSVTLATSLEAAERDAASVNPSASAEGITDAVHALRVTSARRGHGRIPANGAGASRPPAPERTTGPCQACGASHRTDGCKYNNFVCSNCKNKGHLRRVCPHKIPDRAARPWRKNLGNYNQEAHHSCQAGGEESSGTETEEEAYEEPIYQMVLNDYRPA